ncbi:MAG: hypothetical protein OEV86_15970 [Candidatus Krumholzibacteria bacterium]|nr:hypothetical protein [Candidatus Krumholzibacteria bacterium]
MSKPDLNDALLVVLRDLQSNLAGAHGGYAGEYALQLARHVSALENAVVLDREDWEEALDVVKLLLNWIMSGTSKCGICAARARAFLEKHQSKQ